jgi:hypothetical protein
MKTVINATALCVALLLTATGAAFAANPHKPPLGDGTMGQPNQSCETSLGSPGNADTAPGSAFNPDGKAGTVYAGEQPQNSNNPKSVSQYDVACAQVSQ